MRERAILLYIALLVFFPFLGRAQSCSIFSKANALVPDRLCSPVSVNWDVTYTGVNSAGTTVEILYRWDDGSSETIEATQGPAGTFTANTNHIYTSTGDRCNYHPLATLIVNGVECTSSSQEQIVTIWDTDDENGGEVNAEPNVYPVCVGNAATMRFDDGTLFNCVPPQEEDVPNEDTRWIQWVYGTNNTMSSTTPVVVNGTYTGPWEWEGPIITLPGPVHDSNEQSYTITIADDNQIGDEFEVELRYWNFCNPWPGSDPVIDRSVIRIVDYPDATITPAGPVCESNAPIYLTAATGGGIWSGKGITDPAAGEFDPFVAGSGTHRIRYHITSADGCSASDSTDIIVRPAPVPVITPVDPFCINDAPYDLEVVPSGGTWSGNGITDANNGTFDPTFAGLGEHDIVFTTDTDAYGCFGIDSALVEVMDLPFAIILTPDSAWCETADNQTIAEILITGSETSTFDLEVEINGVTETLLGLTADTITLVLDNQPGTNEYVLTRVIEYHGANSCESNLHDILVNEVYLLPDMSVTASNNDLCSPVDVEFLAVDGYKMYYWEFGDGLVELTNSPTRVHTYTIPLPDPPDLMAPEMDFTYKLAIQTLEGCSDTASGSLRIYQQPVADFFVTPEVQDYPATEVTLDNLSSPGDWSYSWDFGDGDSDTEEEPGTHDYGNYGAYDISLATYSEFCSDTAVKTVMILPPPPKAVFDHNPDGCPPLEVNFFNHSEYADSYIWDFDDGSFSTDPNPTHVFFQSREHLVKLTARSLSGSDSTVQIVVVYDRPQALFDVYPDESKSLQQLFKFYNNSVNGDSYIWDFGDGSTSMDVHASHIYGAEGVYTVTLYAWSENECPDTLIRESLVTVIAGEGNTEFPNAFIWNGSGPTGGYWTEGTIDNTVFHPNLDNALEMQMIIYNRWGEKLYESNEVYKGWDGYLKSGELATQGVYVYKAWVTYVSGETEILTGDITFLH